MNRIFMVAIILMSCLSADLAMATQRTRGQYATSKQPYWKVGTLDKKLSSACQRGEFRQRKDLSYTIGYHGKKGQGVTGIALQNWNLIDPKKLSKPNITYHFFNQGYSNCRVYVSNSPLPPRRK